MRWQAADWGEQNQLSADKQALLASGQVFSPRHNRYDILHRDQETLGVSAAYQWRDDYWGNIDVAVLGASERVMEVCEEFGYGSVADFCGHGIGE